MTSHRLSATVSLDPGSNVPTFAVPGAASDGSPPSRHVITIRWNPEDKKPADTSAWENAIVEGFDNMPEGEVVLTLNLPRQCWEVTARGFGRQYWQVASDHTARVRGALWRAGLPVCPD